MTTEKKETSGSGTAARPASPEQRKFSDLLRCVFTGSYEGPERAPQAKMLRGERRCGQITEPAVKALYSAYINLGGCLCSHSQDAHFAALREAMESPSDSETRSDQVIILELLLNEAIWTIINPRVGHDTYLVREGWHITVDGGGKEQQPVLFTDIAGVDNPSLAIFGDIARIFTGGFTFDSPFFTEPVEPVDFGAGEDVVGVMTDIQFKALYGLVHKLMNQIDAVLGKIPTKSDEELAWRRSLTGLEAERLQMQPDRIAEQIELGNRLMGELICEAFPVCRTAPFDIRQGWRVVTLPEEPADNVLFLVPNLLQNLRIAGRSLFP